MRAVALTCLTALLLAGLLLPSIDAEALPRGSGRPAPEPLRPPSPASCMISIDSAQSVAISVGRGTELGEQVHCASAGEAVLWAELPPGQTAAAWLMVENNGAEAVTVAAVHTRAAGSQIGIDVEPVTVDPGASVRLEITLQIATEIDYGSAFLHQINLAVDASDGHGFTTTLPVLLQAIDPDELFRQRFEVEPVLGQFL